MLYLDNSATTAPYPEVVEAVSEVMRDIYGNPSSLHRLGLEAERLLHKARETVAAHFGIEAEQIVFTSGGTESNNLAILGAARAYRNRGKHLMTTRIEHPSVYECFRMLEKEGFEVTWLPVDREGIVSVESVRENLRPDTILVSIMHVNNETGSIQPIPEIGRLLRNKPKVLFHVDAVQSVGKIEVRPADWSVDLMTVSAHKLHGPKGAGLLIRRKGLELSPLMVGGGQEYGLRPGTENVPLVVGMAKAIRMTMEKRENAEKHLYELKKRIVNYVKQTPDLLLNGTENPARTAPHIVNFSFPGMKSEVLLHALEEHGVYVSTRSACSSGDDKPSRVLTAMGCDGERATSAVRISLVPELEISDIDALTDRLNRVVQTFRRHTGKKEGHL